MVSRSDAERRQEILVRAGVVLASELSLPDVLQKIVDLACEVAESKYGALGVLGPDGRISAFFTSGMTDEERRAIGRLPRGDGLLGALIADARPLRLRRIQDDPRSVGFPPRHPPMTSFLGVPVAIRGTVFGNLYLTEKRDAPEFLAEDEEAVVTLATQAGVAIENARLYEEAQSARRRLEAVNEVTHAILEGRATEEVLHLVARHARELVGAAVATVSIPDAEDGDLVLRVAEGDRADRLLGTRFPAETSISGEVMRTLAPVVLTDASLDPHVHQPIVRLGGMGPAVFVPLAAGGRAFGALGVANPTGAAPFTDAALELIQTFAAQAAVALEQAAIRDELQRLALVEDRERIAKELHDDVIQSLFAEGMALQAAEMMVDDPDAMRARLASAVDHIDRVIRDLRNYIFGLKPGALADRQLDRSLRDLSADFEHGSGVTVETHTDPEVVSRLAGRAPDVVQAAREALSNAVRHSGSDRVTVSLLRIGDEEALLEIEDHGKGFLPERAAGRGHGLGNLQDRAKALGGDLEIDSRPGRGTRVRVRIPL